jgi:hypothetical protein
MNQRFLLTTTCPLVLSFAFAVPAKADTILVGTSLTGTAPVAVLSPESFFGNTRFSQFSSPVNFNIDDIKVVIGGPALTGFSTDGSFQVSLVTQAGSLFAPSTVVPVGSGNLPITLMDSFGSNVGVFDFSGLSIPITAGTENYLEIAGANLTWNSSTPLLGTLGTIGLQLSCTEQPPASIRCNNDPAIGVPFPGTYSMQISGDPVGVTPEPSSLLLLGTGLLSIVGTGSRRVAQV